MRVIPDLELIVHTTSHMADESRQIRDFLVFYMLKTATMYWVIERIDVL